MDLDEISGIIKGPTVKFTHSNLCMAKQFTISNLLEQRNIRYSSLEQRSNPNYASAVLKRMWERLNILKTCEILELRRLKVMLISFALSREKYKAKWNCEKSCGFSIKSVCNYLCSSEYGFPYKMVLKAKLPLKLKILCG